MPEGNFDNEEIYPLPPSSPLVSNSPQYLMSSCLKDTRRGNVLENNLDAAIFGLYLMPSCAQALKLSSNGHLKIGLLPFSSKHEEGNFCGRNLRFYRRPLCRCFKHLRISFPQRGRQKRNHGVGTGQKLAPIFVQFFGGSLYISSLPLLTMRQ